MNRKWILLLEAVAGFILLPSPGHGADTSGAATTNFAAHIGALAGRIPPGFTVVSQPPFVVIGDEPAETVRRRATQTVRWAVDKLKQDYFRQEPREIIDIWLFRDGESYTNHARSLFNDEPASRFGYYSAGQRALIMNISTGSGTLVHEIVHPFIAANFPDCPAWFNEGFASLFEAATEQNGHLKGLVNWRYNGLEQAIREKKTISFRHLTRLTGAEFYSDAGGYSQHYAQARYLCYYLQEKGLLVKFYREFVAHVKEDPTGYATLQRVLGEAEMEAFQTKWEKFILEIRTP